jgi:purine-binding chemotaxis protein CheW
MSERAASPEPARAWDSLARSAANAREAGDVAEDIQQLLTFELAGAPYAIRVEHVREIVRMRPVTPVPRLPEDVRGVISLRGEMIELIDLRCRLGLGRIEPTRRTRIIVVQAGDNDVAGVLVDAVREVLRVADDAMRPAAGSETGAVDELCAHGQEFISLIELERVLDSHA